MNLTAYRITGQRYVHSAFDGEGARLNGGRWNAVGTRMVYTAGSISLATLELLVHLRDWATLRHRYAIIPVVFDTSLIEALPAPALPAAWRSPQPLAETQLLGDAWVRRGSSAVLSVPSAVVPSERNYLLNPRHPDFARITIEADVAFAPDPRLLNSD